MSRFLVNPHREQDPSWGDEVSAPFQASDVFDLHNSLDAYKPTPLVSLPYLARSLGVGNIYVKDESHRFGLKAFKALGATYAIYRFLLRHYRAQGRFVSQPRNFYRNRGAIGEGEFTFCTATDGNHGRGVAWTARQLQQKAVIFVPSDTVVSRVDSIEIEGARVVKVDGTYDDTVAAAAEQAEANGWQIISDTSWPGYEDIPRWIMAGYSTLFNEIDRSLGPKERIDVAFIQAGVGSLAGTAAWHYNQVSGTSRPRLVSVEPSDAGCLLESIASTDGQVSTLTGGQHSIMAGLNCGTPSPVAWSLIRSGFDLFLTVPDQAAVEAMRTFHHAQGGDPPIVSGESGAAGLAALTRLKTDKALLPAREQLNLTDETSVLLLNTEGDTDPAHYGQVIAS
ncbi:MAG: diaminopropionate ammonia-lyase [bacterium]|nr:diaminopropionate ammonia-lyase [bacterium]